ncbi:MAG: TolC family protein [Candidatus Latescibacteria bacterium]|nr:TolC family protein [Candidatus Latescibacterota bacterium]
MTATCRSISPSKRGLFCILLNGLLLGGCASGSQQGEALHTLSAQTGVRLENYGEHPPQGVADTLRILQEKPLTAEAAVQLAVLNSPRFQSLLQELGIARADRRQGRLLPNPTLDLAIRREGSGEQDYEYALMEDLKGVLLYPLQRGLANAQYTQARAHLAGDLLAGIEEVKMHYFTLQGLLQTRSLMQSILQTTEAGATLAARQRQAGNINALEETMHQAALQETRLGVDQLEAEIQVTRHTLGQLLGLSGDDWQIAEGLPPLPGADPSLPEVEQTALSQRPDLEAARQAVQIAGQSLRLARFSILPSLRAGVNVKREEERRTLGPALELEIPLFDQGQATRPRARAQQARSRLQVRALEEETRAQVRAHFTRMSLARRTTQHYRDTLIPLRAQAVEEAQKHYNYMLLGVYQLLQVRHEEVAARKQYFSALADYWIARAQLERAVGGPLSPGEERPPVEEQEPPPPAPLHPHHH